ncbi:amino acid ABC transporter substrate-binding protein [Streptomyces agglomeratus]|uniref:ABC transporter substrate-binding protein n=1 Tax=Streptomyces agglomeratus TaxID=285458 RepID=UPI000854BDA5|nr:ABC transporter substrate-binding protein [Streptomyces agglomeratus]OEJ38339.1 amino acid ABC transporter substrate-binding protein [Streptomyces agglomeratus]OEJ47277.1 amino acid ABC transporter substrate-binding protein [Streptomyces agglomeratus]OEJ50867.1 amino acid ABC transporter substrate-binding protein [Streptomyces agglomeratus]OEJ58230.1 amino acid ABC transporter substrate-binding protein [Streptomyces agglomeratus]
MRLLRAAECLLLVALLLLSAACGSRLPERDFEGRRSAPPAREAGPVRIGIITSATSPVGGAAFTGPRDGALAYFDALNADGGIDGRKVEVFTCDDGGSGVGNNGCVHRLLDERKVFALVATTALEYAGAPRVAAAGVPDIGGQPIGPAYDTYPHLYGIYGSDAPRTGGRPGWNGTLYGGTEVYRYFKREHGARTAAVISYNQASSAAYARLVARGLEAEGYRVVSEQVDFALPNFRAVAADLKDRGVDLVFDAMDTHGNAQLCEAMDAVGARVTAKVTNVQNWSSAVSGDFADAPRCRNALWVTGASRNYEDVGHPAVREFREAMRAARREDRVVSQWQLEGWAAAMWFTDAARSCGRGLTRACVEAYLNREEPYTARGLLLPVSFERHAEPPRTSRTCLSVARWRDGAGWVTQGDMTRNCFTVPQLPYRP